MMANLRSMFLLLLLGTASIALALRILDDLQRLPETPAAAGLKRAASGQTIETPEMPKYDPPPIEQFAAALDRPLFNPQRRPSENEPSGTGIVEDRALSATLQGILFANSGSVALLTAVGESMPIHVSQGELFLGWRLLEIHPDRAVFGRDEETVILELIYKAKPTPPQPAKQRVRQRP